jgi:putative ABC transport system ATP-binding protein
MSDVPILAMEGVALDSGEGVGVFQDLDWRLQAGDRVCLKGGSGTGNTALLRLCAGLAHPQAGRVVLAGTPLGPFSFEHPFLREGGLGWVPTEGGLVVNMSLLANVMLPLRFVKRMGREEAEAAALGALERAGLGPLAGRRPHAVEARERWLTALVRTAAMGCTFWLVDRPSGALGRTVTRVARDLLGSAALDPAWTLVGVAGDWMPPFPVRDLFIEKGRLALEETP